MKKSLFCSVCGEGDVALHESLCFNCYWKENRIIEKKLPKLSLNTCIDCLSIKLPSGWTKVYDLENLSDLVHGYVRRELEIEINDESEFLNQEYPDWDKPKPKLSCLFKVMNDRIDSFSVYEETRELDIHFLWGNCAVCRKKKSGGDTVLQIRAIERELTEEEEEYFDKKVKEIIEKASSEDHYAFASDKVYTYKGFDYKLGSNALAERMIEAFVLKWVAITSVNYSLIGEAKDRTRKYSHTYLFKLPGVVEGDLAVIGGEIFGILKTNTKGVLIKSLETGLVSTEKNWKDLRPFRDYYREKFMIVSKEQDSSSYELMNLKTYETFEIENKGISPEIGAGEEVELLIYKDKYYPIPNSLK